MEIKGYRELTENEVATINKLKELAEDVGAVVESFSGAPSVDQRWLAIAKTDLQKGFMSLVRSVSKPTTF